MHSRHAEYVMKNMPVHVHVHVNHPSVLDAADGVGGACELQLNMASMIMIMIPNWAPSNISFGVQGLQTCLL